MIITKRKFAIELMFFLTVALFVFFILFDTYSWGKYVFLGLSLSIFFVGSLLNQGKVRLKFDTYVAINLLFIFFSFVSSLWAIDPMDSVIMSRTLFRTFICVYIVYISYLNVQEFDVTILLKAVMWAGYIVALYSLGFYGLERMILAGSSAGLRVTNEFANVNTIGLSCALSCMIQLGLKYVDSNTKLFPTVFFMVPCIIVIAATQSRKALVFLIAGFLGFIFIKVQSSSKNISAKILKFTLGIIICIFLVYILLQTELFSGIQKRMQGLMNSFVSGGKIDNSTLMRDRLRLLGLQSFSRHPIIGIGIANPHIIASDFLGYDAYLHDNFIELLCGGGIIGFSLYYSIYAYLFTQLFKYKNIEKGLSIFFIIWLVIMFIMNFGMVTYYDKAENYYLMIHFVYIISLKRKAIMYECK